MVFVVSGSLGPTNTTVEYPTHACYLVASLVASFIHSPQVDERRRRKAPSSSHIGVWLDEDSGLARDSACSATLFVCFGIYGVVGKQYDGHVVASYVRVAISSFCELRQQCGITIATQHNCGRVAFRGEYP